MSGSDALSPSGRPSDAASSTVRRPAGYRRSAGSPRGEARRRELLTLVTDDLLANGLADFSLRRAARAAGATHKVLLYYFDSAEDLLAHAVGQLRSRRIAGGLSASFEAPGTSLVERVRLLWPVLIGAEADVLDQAMGLAQYDPRRYGRLAAGATEDYLRALVEICPTEWSGRRKHEVAAMILAALRGFLLTRRTSAVSEDASAGFAALERALAREEASAE